MSATNHLINAQKNLDALDSLLRQAAAGNRPAGEFLDRALSHLFEARQIIGSLSDEEGTE
jgi:hypothetical protein